ncbi:hypothetical protein [Thermococcus pacificus]|uniref:Uncharacterized protein n=1 Tax=Thermococcus pacificus TaxID=71998 RepID=A0A218P9Y7_9EURY|nr:hypothetical protein [Thermococcus pacificus]ASJ07583.1 hypothetical protein A3L08_09755 [Thermococcus pacificus]
MEREILELLSLERTREPLSPGRRVREFQKTIQTLKNGEDVELKGFLLARKPPNAPRDAVYYLLSPLPPSELASLGENDFRTYLVIRATEETLVSGEVKPGNYVLVRGIIDAYPWGNMRVVYASSIEGMDYPDYWKDYQEFALSKSEVVDLFERTVYLRDDMRNALIYSVYGVPYIIGESWGEGFEFTVFKYRDDSGLLALWKAFKYFHSNLPWEVRLGSERVIEVDDPFLGIDFRLGNPNASDMRYYTPLTKRGLVKLPKKVAGDIVSKRAIGLLPRNLDADPLDRMARLSETPFVLVPSEEKPYFEENREFLQLIPNLLVTVFIQREKHKALDREKTRLLEEELLRWLKESRDDYGDPFRALTAPSGPMNVKLRAELGKRVFGSIVRFNGRVTKRAAREVKLINEAIVNDWMVVLKDRPREMMRLLREYRAYVPGTLKAQRALEILHDLASVSPSGEVTKEEFIRELVKDGFQREDALEITEKFIATGYVYEPFPGKIRPIR